MSVTHAFKRDENAGKGFENITAKRAGSHEGKRDFNIRLRWRREVERGGAGAQAWDKGRKV